MLDFVIPRGDKGEQGLRGIKGDVGPQGPQGVKGDKGEQGTGVTIKGRYDSVSALKSAHPKGNDGDAYMVGVNLYAWSGSEWIDCGNVQGPQGIKGATGAAGTAATIKVGTVTTGAAGTAAKVVNSGTTSAAVLDFTIPQGAKGEKGEKGEQGAGSTVDVEVATNTEIDNALNLAGIGTLPSNNEITVETLNVTKTLNIPGGSIYIG